jgi:hypothetical protein
MVAEADIAILVSVGGAEHEVVDDDIFAYP